jgi:ribosome-associated translation inhibitor RaiA
MQPLTHQVWEQHFVELRPVILERFPAVDRESLQVIEDDYDGLVALVQRATGMDADRTIAEIRALEVEELGLGIGNGHGGAENEASLAKLNLGTGFAESERERIVERLNKLNRHLKRFRADATYLELSVKDRDTGSQQVTLECEVPGFPRLVATSKEADLRAALADVRDDLVRQINDAVDKRNRGR